MAMNHRPDELGCYLSELARVGMSVAGRVMKWRNGNGAKRANESRDRVNDDWNYSRVDELVTHNIVTLKGVGAIDCISLKD